MHLQESGEMYLETILILSKEKPSVRAVDIGEYMHFSKPSVSRAVGLLKNGGFLTVDACKIEHDISDETFAALCRHRSKYNA